MNDKKLLFIQEQLDEIRNTLLGRCTSDDLLKIHLNLIRCNLLLLKIEDETIFENFSINHKSFLELLLNIKSVSPEYHEVVTDIHMNLVWIESCKDENEFSINYRGILKITEKLVETLETDFNRLR